MTHVLAVSLTTVLPSLAGVLATRGALAVRLAVGGVLGLAAFGIGSVIGGLVGLVLPGALAGVLAVVLIGTRHPVDLGDRLPSAIAVVLLAIVVAFGIAMIVVASQRPVARWDAWAIWAMKAKALAHWGSFRNPVFLDPVYSYTHQDYPPLLSAWQSITFKVSGDLTASWMTQVQLAWLWTLATAASIAVVDRWGSLAGLLPFAWALSPSVLDQALWGFADVPMALLLVVGVSLLVSAATRVGAFHAGLILAAAGLTKGEGFILAVLVAIPFLSRPARWRLAAIAGGLAVAAHAPWLVFTRLHGLGNDVLNAENLDPSRLATVAPARIEGVMRGIGSQVADITEWGPLMLVLVVALMLGRSAWRLGAATLLGIGLFVGVYLVTPLDVEHHMSRSVHRVVIAPMGLAALTGAFALRDDARRIPPR